MASKAYEPHEVSMIAEAVSVVCDRRHISGSSRERIARLMLERYAAGSTSVAEIVKSFDEHEPINIRDHRVRRAMLGRVASGTYDCDTQTNLLSLQNLGFATFTSHGWRLTGAGRQELNKTDLALD